MEYYNEYMTCQNVSVILTGCNSLYFLIVIIVHVCKLSFVLGYINEDRLRDLLITMGDRFTDEEVGLPVQMWL